MRRARSIQTCSAAGLLLGVLLIPAVRKGARSASGRAATAATAAMAAMAAQDQKDDALLRDVARLSRGEDGGAWNTLAPEPGAVKGTEEEQL